MDDIPRNIRKPTHCFHSHWPRHHQLPEDCNIQAAWNFKSKSSSNEMIPTTSVHSIKWGNKAALAYAVRVVSHQNTCIYGQKNVGFSYWCWLHDECTSRPCGGLVLWRYGTSSWRCNKKTQTHMHWVTGCHRDQTAQGFHPTVASVSPCFFTVGCKAIRRSKDVFNTHAYWKMNF